MTVSNLSAAAEQEQNNEPCPICKGQKIVPWIDRVWCMPGSNDPHYYRRCESCEAISCHPMPNSEALGKFYQQHFDYAWYHKVRRLKAIQAAHRWHRVQSLLSDRRGVPGRLLDVGCGHGWFLKRARHSGWTVTGIDYPSLATLYAREQLGLDILEGDVRTIIQKQELVDRSFDLITAWHFLEHHPSPHAIVKELSKLLAPNGKLLLVVPNAHSLGMAQRKDQWIWCQPPYVHVIHFTERSLVTLLVDSGLEILQTWTRDTWDAQPGDANSGGLWKLSDYIERF